MNPDEIKKDFLEYIFEYPPTQGEWKKELKTDWTEAAPNVDVSKLWEWMQNTLEVPKPFDTKTKKESEWDK